MLVYTTSSSTALTEGIAIQDFTNSGYLFRVTTKLNADQWYILNISTSIAQSPSVAYYTTPIKMSTHSGMSATGNTTGYLEYDYNNACGFIFIAPEPLTMTSFTVSGTEIGTEPPKSINEN